MGVNSLRVFLDTWLGAEPEDTIKRSVGQERKELFWIPENRDYRREGLEKQGYD